ncbi:peptide/nickel transport system substrate-binding protein [Stella humosa]|uniref:Peptide/nickel transport system substrate-binding protein n=1 Tax=Stella humosa TaxID=94 RepID=A0A3N1KYN8_9PROT|nr:ABC transporter substrate-binding protein [Stella humosa]ROP84532.1 peptide/nickel transport system substrate-binding protein [Stella humosa]BBK34052.1 peptide ABC transporter substrate-binding protein [Stella humosa]
MIAKTLLTAGLALLAAGQVAIAQEQPRRGGTLNFSIAAEPPTYDCHASSTFAVIQRMAPHYSTVLKYEPHKYPAIVGDLAESWTVSPDNLSYTVKLHPGVLFHDGTTLTSEDVKASYDRIANPPAGINSARRDSMVKLDSISTPDPLTVVFKLKEVDVAFLNNLASPWNCIFSAAKLKADPNFPAKNVLGTGPFKFTGHVAGSTWTGERFDGYFRKGHPYLDGFRAITMSSSAMLNALAGGQVDAEFRGVSPPERDRIVRELGQNAQVFEEPWLLHMLVTFNNEKAPFNDARVRKALSIAIDRWGAGASLGRISPLRNVGGILPPGSPYASTDEELVKLPGFGKDMVAARAEARRLLKEAGQENLTFTLANRSIAPYVANGIYLIDQWRQIGVKVEHQQLELAAYFSSMSSGNYDVIIDSFTDYSPDPNTGAIKYISTDRSPQAFSRHTDRKLDELFDLQAKTTDQAERRKLIRELEFRALDQAYAVPFLYWHRIVVMNQRVRNWSMSPFHMIYQDLGDVWLRP